MKNESEILCLYIDENADREIIKHPFTQDGYVYATDSHILIRVNKNIVEGEYQQQEKPGCSHLFINTRKELVINIELLEKLLSNIERVEEEKTVGEDIVCDECRGEGQVLWEYKRFEEYFDCPKCDGSGHSIESKNVPTGKMIPDPDALIELGGKTFSVKYISILIKTMELLGIYTVIMHYNDTPHEQVIFNFRMDISVVSTTIAQSE